jgi:catechol 2,3-dioxygenase-like lactoylglutathione lyase family enzyme
MMPDVADPVRPEPGLLHHVELWVPDLARATRSWGWLLTALGAEPFQSWEHGRSWRSGHTYVVLEQSPALVGDQHERRSPGLNHLAFWVPGRPRPEARGGLARREDDGVPLLDALVAEAPAHGWTLLFPERHPWAGGPGHRAAYLEDADGYEVELVTSSSDSGGTRKPPQPS